MKTIKFTTRAVIIDGVHAKAQYTMDDAETLEISLVTPDGQPAKITLKKGAEHYAAARAAYDEKQAKRSGANNETDIDSIKGIKLDAGWFRIEYDASIDRCVVTFKKKPGPETRELVKAYGFWWTPSHKCWSRKLNKTAWWAGQELYSKLTA